MPEFYHEIITEKSFEILQDIKRKFPFILIGGWAVFFYTRSLKSKDIDIIISYDVLEKLKEEFSVQKNDRLSKYEIKMDVDIDIYLSYFSKLGFPVEEIAKHTQSVEGFTVPIPEILLILKVYTFTERRGTSKGEKDAVDIFSLLSEKLVDWQKYQELLLRFNLQTLNNELKELLQSRVSVNELGLSEHQLARLKKDIFPRLKSFV